MARTALHTTVDAPRDIVWGVLTTSDDWSDWAGEISHSVRVAEGSPHPDGVGAQRELWAMGVLPLREDVVEYDPDGGRYGYTLRPMPPIKGYRATVTLTDEGDRTRVEWSVDVIPLLPVPGLGTVLAGVVRLVISRLLAGLAAESERRATAHPAAA